MTMTAWPMMTHEIMNVVMMMMMMMLLLVIAKMMVTMMTMMMTVVSRNLAINFVCSKLEPFIRGHDLPAQDCQIVNDDDDDDDADVADDGDGDTDGDADDEPEPFTRGLNCSIHNSSILECTLHNAQCTR